MNICRIAGKNVSEVFLKDRLCPNLCFFRNAFVVKRVNKVPISRINAHRPRVLKARHFVYETVEDTDLIEPSDLHIVLTTFVEGIGDVGDVISIDAQYARDHLLLPRKAVYATPEGIQKYSTLKKSRTGRPMFSSIHAGMTVRCLSKLVIPVFMNSEAPWTLEKNHIQIAFRIEGFHVPEDAIEMPKDPINGPDPAKEGNDFAVEITINNAEKVPVRCRIFHIQSGLETAKIPDDVYLDKSEPILEEQKDLLAEMPMPEIINDPTANVSLIEKYRIQYIN